MFKRNLDDCGFAAFGKFKRDFCQATNSIVNTANAVTVHCRCCLAGGGCGARRAGAVAPPGSLEPKWHNATHLNPTPHAPANDNLSTLVHFFGVYWQYLCCVWRCGVVSHPARPPRGGGPAGKGVAATAAVLVVLVLLCCLPARPFRPASKGAEARRRPAATSRRAQQAGSNKRTMH